MTRLRIWFALVALLCLAAVGALVSRSLSVADTERRLRHDAVAERVLDEMERSLSDLIAAEEARGLAAPDRPTEPERDFVVGRYELGPDGAITSVSAGQTEELEHLLRGAATAPATGSLTGPFGSLQQSAGTTVPLSPPSAAAPLQQKAAPEKKAEAYEILAKLNRGAEVRAKARGYVTAEEVAKDKVSRFADRRDEPREADAALSLQPARAPAVSEAVLSPLHARVLDPSHLALERSVAVGGRTARQGLVIAVPPLFAWLRNETLGGELAGLASVDFAGPVASELPAATGEFVYRRRFAEPFDALGAQLVLAPLPGVGTAGAIEGLGAALVLVLALGLLVAYRTVATVVGFAERRAAFAASVSHELKTPLTAIRMYAEMLRDGIVTSEAKRDEYYRALAVESDRLSRLVNNVLEFSQLEKGARKLALGVAPVEPALREALEILRVHVESEGFQLVVDIAPNLPPARFERDALAQIVFNLVDNAAKYARGAARREVVVSLGPTPNGVVLKVRDFGPGVPREQLGLVFDAFWRGDSELTRRAKGTGIGLALVRRLAEAMGGSARARNAEPQGFEVEVELAGGSAQ
jgi:signal transduction histidine kinase